MGSRVWLKLWLNQFELSAVFQGLRLTGRWWFNPVEKSCFKENSWPKYFQVCALGRHYIVSSNYKHTWSHVSVQTSGQGPLAHEAASWCAGAHHNKDSCCRRRKFLPLSNYSTGSSLISAGFLGSWCTEFGIQPLLWVRCSCTFSAETI